MEIPQRLNIGKELVDRTAVALLRLGVLPEQRVLFVMPDSPELAAGYLAAMKIGAVAVPCNPLLRPADYAYFLEESRAPVLVTAASCLDKIESVLAAQRHLKHVLVLGLDEGRGALASFDKVLAAAPAQRVDAADTSRDEAAFWLWTSGSTGRPKAAVHTHQDWPHCCERYGKGILGITAEDRCFSASKLFHAYGLGNALAFPFWVGASTVLAPERPTADVAYRGISEGRPTIFFGVPTLYASMLQVPEVEQRFDLRSLRLCVSPRAGQAKPGSTGLPVDGYQVRIIDEHGETVAPGGTGDLIVRGPSTALYYWNRRDQTCGKMRGDWFFSGDKFRQTEDGEFHYVGRTDDMFKSGGEWISPADVESALVAHTAVLECAVVPKQSEGLLRPQAHVVLVQGRQGSDALADELRQRVRSRCPGYLVPREIRFVAERPKTATGKIQRYVLRGEQ